PNAGGLDTVQQGRCIGRGGTIVLVHPDPGPEMPGITVRIGDIVAMRKQDIGDAAKVLEFSGQRVDVPRRIDEQVAFVARSEIRMRPKRRACVVPATIESRRELLRKQTRRLGAMALCADGRRRAQKHRTPRSEFLLFVRGLPAEYRFSMAV